VLDLYSGQRDIVCTRNRLVFSHTEAFRDEVTKRRHYRANKFRIGILAHNASRSDRRSSLGVELSGQRHLDCYPAPADGGFNPQAAATAGTPPLEVGET